MNPDLATPEDPDVRPDLALPPNLSPAGREEFIDLVRTYARDLRDELDKEPSFEGIRGRAEVRRAASRLRRIAETPTEPPTSPAEMGAGADDASEGVVVRQAVVAAFVVLGGYLIPYLGLSPMYLVAYLGLQLGLLAVLVIRRR